MQETCDRSASLPPKRIWSTSSIRSASVDGGLDVFHFPDGTEFVLPSAWFVKQYINENPKRFRTSAYCSLNHGDFELRTNFTLEDLPLKRIEKPERCQPTREGWFVEKDRLFSVFQAMIQGEPLPPVRVEINDAGCLRVANGFHRYYASVILGYSEIPVLRSRPVLGTKQLTACHEEFELNPEHVRHSSEDDPAAYNEALTILPPKRGTIPSTPCKQQKHPPSCRPRYEPPAARRERLLREAQEKKKQELNERAAAWKLKVVSKEALDQDRCQRMKKPSTLYAQKVVGLRAEASTLPCWDDEPVLRKKLPHSKLQS